MEFKVLSKENREGNCNMCGDRVFEMAFIKENRKNYLYTCFDCVGVGESKREKKIFEIIKIDEERLAREEVVTILLNLAEGDEKIFKDQRLLVVHSFEEEILEGIINEKLEKYIRFNGNDIGDVLKLRNFAIEANKRDNPKFSEVVDLYKQSRIKKLSNHKKNRIKILLTDKEVQCLEPDYKIIWEQLVDIRNEAYRDSSYRRYDNIQEIQEIIRFHSEKNYLTEYQLKRLKSFYYEMVRRNKKKTT